MKKELKIMKLFICKWFGSLMVLALMSTITLGQESEEKIDPVVAEIQQTLSVQADAWNNNDLDRFMETYWKSEDLTFSSGGKTTRGWEQTLANYRKSFPSGEMGQLTFDHLETVVLDAGSALVLGQWHLQIADKNRDGNFSLVLRKLDGQWKIIHDHSSRLKPKPPAEEKDE